MTFSLTTIIKITTTITKITLLPVLFEKELQFIVTDKFRNVWQYSWMPYNEYIIRFYLCHSLAPFVFVGHINSIYINTCFKHFPIP